MEFIVNKIISIDKDAENYRQGIENILKEKEKELEEKIRELKNDWIKEEKAIKEEIMQEKLTKAQEKAEIINLQKEEQLKAIKDKYLQKHNDLVNEVFIKIISSL